MFYNIFMKKKYNSSCHQKYRLRYHVIFSTKYRRRCLVGLEEDVRLAFKYSESISDYKILYLGIDKDHVHMLLDFKPDLSVGQVIRRIKSITTNKLWQTSSDHLSLFFWKNKKILWTGGYFVETVGQVSESNIEEYIKNQGS